MKDLTLSKELDELLFAFTDKAEYRDYPNGAVLEQENASFCLSPSQFTPTNEAVLMASLPYLEAEASDCLLITNKPTHLMQVDPTWSEAVDRYGRSESMYGFHLLGNKFSNGYTQLDMITRKFLIDKHTRQACFLILKREHMLSDDIPCTIGMNFRIRDGQLNASVHMRSCDLINGLPHDIAFARLVQRLIVTALTVANSRQFNQLKIGSLNFSIDSFHVYERDFETFGRLNFKLVELQQICSNQDVLNFIEHGPVIHPNLVYVPR